MVRKTVKTCSLVLTILFAFTAIIAVEYAVPAYAVARLTIPYCTLDIVAGTTTLHLTNDTIADYIQQGVLTEISGEANKTRTSGDTWTMDQYRGVSLLDVIHLVCELTSSSTITLNATDNFKVTYNYSAITSRQINTYTNKSALTYASGKWTTSTMSNWNKVPHNAGETLIPIIAYYVNPVSAGTSNGPTAFAGWQGISSGPLRNVVLGCANMHYTADGESNQHLWEIIITNPGTINIPEFPAGIMLPAISCLMLVTLFTAFRKRLSIQKMASVRIHNFQ